MSPAQVFICQALCSLERLLWVDSSNLCWQRSVCTIGIYQRVK